MAPINLTCHIGNIGQAEYTPIHKSKKEYIVAPGKEETDLVFATTEEEDVKDENAIASNPLASPSSSFLFHSTTQDGSIILSATRSAFCIHRISRRKRDSLNATASASSFKSSTPSRSYQGSGMGTADSNQEISAALCFSILFPSNPFSVTSQGASHSSAPYLMHCIAIGYTNGQSCVFDEYGKLLVKQRFRSHPVRNLICLGTNYSQSLSNPSSSTTTAEQRKHVEDEAEGLLVLYADHTGILIEAKSLWMSIRLALTQESEVDPTLADHPHLNTKLYSFPANVEMDRISACPSITAPMMVDSSYSGALWSTTLSPRFLSFGSTPLLAVLGITRANDDDQSASVSEMVDKVKNVVSSAFSFAKTIFTASDVTPETPVKRVAIPSVMELSESHRQALSATICPFTLPNGKLFAAVADSLARVLIVDVDDLEIVRVLKGYRNAQCGWIRESETGAVFLIIYTSKGILELAEMGGLERRFACQIFAHGRLVQHAANPFGLSWLSSLSKTKSDDQLSKKDECACYIVSPGGDVHTACFPSHDLPVGKVESIYDRCRISLTNHSLKDKLDRLLEFDEGSLNIQDFKKLLSSNLFPICPQNSRNYLKEIFEKRCQLSSVLDQHLFIYRHLIDVYPLLFAKKSSCPTPAYFLSCFHNSVVFSLSMPADAPKCDSDVLEFRISLKDPKAVFQTLFQDCSFDLLFHSLKLTIMDIISLGTCLPSCMESYSLRLLELAFRPGCKMDLAVVDEILRYCWEEPIIPTSISSLLVIQEHLVASLLAQSADMQHRYSGSMSKLQDILNTCRHLCVIPRLGERLIAKIYGRKESTSLPFYLASHHVHQLLSSLPDDVLPLLIQRLEGRAADLFSLYIIFELGYHWLESGKSRETLHQAVTGISLLSNPCLRASAAIGFFETFIKHEILGLLDVFDKSRRIPNDKVLARVTPLKVEDLDTFLVDCKTLLLAMPGSEGESVSQWRHYEEYVQTLLAPNVFADYAVGILHSSVAQSSIRARVLRQGGVQSVMVLAVIVKYQLKLVRPLRLVSGRFLMECGVVPPQRSSGNLDGEGVSGGSERDAFLGRLWSMEDGDDGGAKLVAKELTLLFDTEETLS